MMIRILALAGLALPLLAAAASADTVRLKRHIVVQPMHLIQGPVIAIPPVGPLCPEGWVPATPPLNPALGCLPNTITN